MHPTYMQIREFGVDGWQKFAATLLLSDRLDVWLPSGEDLKAAQEQGKSAISEDDFIRLMEEKIIRVGGRDFNFGLGNQDQALYKPDGSRLSKYLYDIAQRHGSLQPYIELHPDYGSSTRALYAVTNRHNNDQVYNRARSLVNQHLGDRDVNHSGIDCIPEIVFKRAEFFLAAENITDLSIREVFVEIKKERDEWERMALAVTSELIRLSLEHSSIQKAHLADTHVSSRNYASTFHTVANHAIALTRERMPPELALDDMVELIEDLLGNMFNGDIGAGALLKRHKVLQSSRDKMWGLICKAANMETEVSAELEGLLADMDPLNQMFGKDKWASGLGKASVGELLQKLICAAIETSLTPTVVGSAILKTATFARKLQVGQHAVTKDLRAWPTMLMYGQATPAKEHVIETLRVIQRRLASKKRVV